MDRGYDDNKIFQRLWDLEQNFVIRLTQKRKLFFHRKWVPATKLCAKRKGKVKMNLFYKGKAHEAYISHVKVQLTAAKENVYLVLVYGITEHPMMLVTNKTIHSKDDVIKVARLYFSRWRIEEYFRSKKQILDFENFRVRSLVSSRKKDCEVLIFSKRDSNTVSPEGEGRDFLSAVIHSPFSPTPPIYDHKSRYYTPDNIVAKIEFHFLQMIISRKAPMAAC